MVADIVGPAGDVESDSFANECTVEGRSRTGGVEGEDTVGPDTDGPCPDPPLWLIAVSYDRDLLPDPHTSGFPAHSRKKAFHPPSAPVTLKNQTEEARAAPKTAFANGAVLTTASVSTWEVDTRTATIGEAATITDCITVGRATPDITSDAALAAVTDGSPPLDRDTTLHTGDGTGEHNVTAVNDQTDATAAFYDATNDAQRGAGEGELGTSVDSRGTAAATTDSVTDARRARAA